MSDRKAVIKNADMSEEMQQVRLEVHGKQKRQFFPAVLRVFERNLSTQDAVDCATQALEKYNIEKDIAAYIKKEFDKK